MPAFADIRDMRHAGWRERLAQAIQDSDRSMRAISIAAGMGKGYVHSILKEDKDPTVDHLIAVCDELGISLSWVLYGFEISDETEEILTRLQNNPDARAGILQILRSHKEA